MLYDPKWEKAANTISLMGLILWLRQQDPATKYEFGNIFDCLNARYLRSIGIRVLSCGTTGYSYTKSCRLLPFIKYFMRGDLPAEMNKAAVYGFGTYGGALIAAEKLLPRVALPKAE